MGQDAYPQVYCQQIAYKPKVKPGQLSEEQIKRFYDEGYVLLEDFFDTSLLDNAKKSIEELVDEIAVDLLKAGKNRLYVLVPIPSTLPLPFPLTLLFPLPRHFPLLLAFL